MIVAFRLPAFVFTPLLAWAMGWCGDHLVDETIPNARELKLGKTLYLTRWYIRRADGPAKGKRGNLFIHRFWRSDDDRAQHDHPWWNVSVVLTEGYWEHVGEQRLWRAPGTVIFRSAGGPELEGTKHRIELEPGTMPFTLFATGRKVRDWGYHCPNGWVLWSIFDHLGCANEIEEPPHG